MHPRIIRTAPCVANGTGTKTTMLKLNMFALPGDPDYCGVTFSNVIGI